MSTKGGDTAVGGAGGAGNMSAFGWISMGVTLLTVVFALFSKGHNDKTETADVSVEITPPHTDSQPLPRTYGTCKVRANTVWWGNVVIKDSTIKEINKRYY